MSRNKLLVSYWVLAATLCAAMQLASSMDRRSTNNNKRTYQMANNRLLIDSAPIIDPIYDEIFGTDVYNLMTRRELRNKLEEAYTVLTNPEHVYICENSDRTTKVNRDIKLLHAIAVDNYRDCSYDKISQRIDAEENFKIYPNLETFMEYYNGLLVMNCARNIFNQIVSSEHRITQLFNADDNWNLKKVVKLANKRRQILINSDDYNSDDSNDLEIQEDSLRNTSVVVMQYLSQKFGFLEVEKPIDRPMLAQLEHIGKLIDQVFFKECQKLAQIHGVNHSLYLLMQSYDQRYIKHLFNSNEFVRDLLEQMRICHHFTNSLQHMYLLGRYHLDTLVDTIEDAGSLAPNEMRDLIETLVYLGQAEVSLGYNHADLLRNYLELLVISQISVQKCQDNYFKLMRHRQRDLMMLDEQSSMCNYVKHYVHLQIVACLPSFEGQISTNLNNLEDSDDSLDEIDKIYDIFKEISSQIEPSLKLYSCDNIPYDVVRLASEKILHSYGFDLFNWQNDFHDDETFHDKMFETQDQVENLFDSCRSFMNQMRNSVQLFRLFMSLDTNNNITSSISEDSLIALSKYNVCKSLVNLSERTMLRSLGHINFDSD